VTDHGHKHILKSSTSLNCFSINETELSINKAKGGDRMNKKVMQLTLTLIVIFMMVPPLIGTAQALGKPSVGETFYLDPATDEATIVGETTIISPTVKPIGPDDTFRLGKDGYRSYDYVGVLGEGVMYVETVSSLAKRVYNEKGGFNTEGDGTYKVVLDITADGGYGTGTLEGMCRIHWENDVPPGTTPRTEQWWTMSLHGKGDLNGLNVFAEAYATRVDPPPPLTYKQWWTITTIMS